MDTPPSLSEQILLHRNPLLFSRLERCEISRAGSYSYLHGTKTSGNSCETRGEEGDDDDDDDDEDNDDDEQKQ